MPLAISDALGALEAEAFSLHRRRARLGFWGCARYLDELGFIGV